MNLLLNFILLSVIGFCASELGNVDSQNPSCYDRIIVKGKPWERGLSHGKQAAAKIQRSITYYKSKFSKELTWEECVNFTGENYIPAIREFYPTGLEEMSGIAEGANVLLSDIIILNARYDLSRIERARQINKKRLPKGWTTSRPILAEEECTGAVALKSATAAQDVLLGQNWDLDEFIMKNDTAILLEVHPDPEEKIKPFVMLTEAGQLGRSGMNSDGMGITAMSLWSTEDIFKRDPIKHKKGWVPISLLRRMFLEAPNFSMGLRAILHTPRHVSTNMIVATAEDEALNIELTPNHYFVMQVPLDKEVLSHSNHFKTPAFTARDDIEEGSRGSSSLFRDRRVEKALLKNWPKISEESFKTAFKDHVGYPSSVCAHSVPPELNYTSANPRETTVASIIFNLSQRKYFLCKGPPCQGSYVTYYFGTAEEPLRTNSTMCDKNN